MLCLSDPPGSFSPLATDWARAVAEVVDAAPLFRIRSAHDRRFRRTTRGPDAVFLSALSTVTSGGHSLYPTNSSSPTVGSAALSPASGGQNLIYSYDGNNGIPIQPLIGADTWYDQGVFGQGTVVANVEGGLAWNQHDWLKNVTTFSDSAAGSSDQYDWHATAVTFMLGGYDPTQSIYGYPYYKLGMAPFANINSAAIATGWYNSSDPTDTNAYFNVTPKTFYTAYNNYFTTNYAHTVNLYGIIGVTQTGPADVINSSWGFTDTTGQDPMTQAIDGFAYAHPATTVVLAAGNSTSPTSASNNVGGPASGWNSISVGAVGDYTYNNYSVVSDFSSRGPQDYSDPMHGTVSGVRAPVSLVAPGTALLASYYGGQTGSNSPNLVGSMADASSGATNWFVYGLAGTSFASPIVAGGVSLLDSASYYLLWNSKARDARVIKAVLMNSADKLPGWDNGQYTDSNGVVVTKQGVDWSQGAGLIDLNKAFQQYLPIFYGGTAEASQPSGTPVYELGWANDQLSMSSDPNNPSHNDYPIINKQSAGSILDVTLCWFRDLGTPVFTDNSDPDLQELNTTDQGFANLDLEIWNSTFTQLYAESISQYNDVQELHFTIPADGYYGLRVVYAGQMFGTPQTETYGLAWSVPEPGTIALLLAALAGGMILRRRWTRRRRPSRC